MLLSQQIKAISKIQRLKVGALFMEPGSGKTRAAYELVKSVEDIDYILWLTPFNTKQNLIDEIEKCGGFECEFDVVGIESLSKSNSKYLYLHQKLKSTNCFIVCDESLKIKNFEAKRTQRIITLSKLSKYKLILNGTPVSRNILDIWAQMEFLSPKILNMDINEYKNTFCEYVIVTKIIGKSVLKKETIKRFHNVDYLYSLIQHYVYECDLDIGVGRQNIELKYNLDYQPRLVYNNLKNNYLNNEMLQFKNNNIFIEMTQKMQHAYCCSQEKIDLLSDVVELYGESNIIVFCKFLDSVKFILSQFPNLHVLTYGKHAFGFNFQNYNTVVFFDKTFDYAQKLQAERRIWRSGQKRTCYFIEFTGDVGLEKLINENVDKKRDLLHYFKKTGLEQVRDDL